MSKHQKPKTAGNRNDSRPNGKASKQHPGRTNTGSKHTQMSEIDLVIMGKGLYQRVSNRAYTEKLKSRQERKTRSETD